jgi:acylphosphatase
LKKHLAIKIYGRVQNVGFRFYTRKKAAEFGIMGYVKNESDGSVYIEAEGESGNLDEFTSWCYRGPDWARVDEVKINEEPLQDYTSFSVR